MGAFGGHHFAGALAYADDMVLLAPSTSGRSHVHRLSNNVGRKREPGDYRVVHAHNVYANFAGYRA